MVFFSPKPSDPCYPWESKSSVAPPRRTEEVPFGGGQHIIIYAKLHVVCKKALQNNCVFPIWFCLHLFMDMFFEKTDKQNSHNSTTYFFLKWFVSRWKGFRKLELQQPCNSCRRNIRWAGGFHQDEGGSMGNEDVGPPKKNLGKVATPMFLNMVHPENYLGKMITHFDPFWWILIFRRGLVKNHQLETSWNSDVFAEIKK